MLLAALDTPFDAPQTMAFAIDRERLAAFRNALRAIVETADAGPLQALWAKHEGHHLADAARIRYRIPTTKLRGLSALLTRAGRDVPRNYVEWIDSRMTVDFCASQWLDLAATASRVEDVDELRRQGASFFADSYLDSFVEQLERANEETAVAACRYELHGPEGNVAWINFLRFRHLPGGDTTSTIVDPTGDVVICPSDAGVDDFDWNPFGMLDLVRGRLALGSVLEALVGAFVSSRGPGPFLPRPPNALPIEDPSWRCLPLFEVGKHNAPAHWNWPLFEAHFLDGTALAVAEASVRNALPDRAWHDAFNLRSIVDADWYELVEQHWPRCRDRFVDLLSHAAETDHAVLLLSNDLSHPLWFGPELPPRIHV